MIIVGMKRLNCSRPFITSILRRGRIAFFSSVALVCLHDSQVTNLDCAVSRVCMVATVSHRTKRIASRDI